MRFLITGIFTLDHTQKSQNVKRATGIFQDPNPETRPEQSQPARALRKKRGQEFDPYEARPLFPRREDSRDLPFPALRPSRCQCMNRAASRTRQSPMPSSLLSPPVFLLRFPHPIRNNKNPNQLLDSHTPAPGQIFQLQENPTI